MKILNYLTIALLIVSLFFSCKKDEHLEEDNHEHQHEHDAKTGLLTLQFENKVGSEKLVLDSKLYKNMNGDTFNITVFKYYISNIKLTASDNSEFSQSESYYLVDESDANSLKITLSNVPFKEYKSITYTIGVDSVRNVSGAQTGALDPAKGMFWSWNNGYIMAKFEGTSPQSTANGNVLMYHVGGFSGANSTLSTVTLPFNSNATVTTAITPMVFVKANLLEWFHAPNHIDFSVVHTIHMPGTNAKLVADNYADMFSITSVVN